MKRGMDYRTAWKHSDLVMEPSCERISRRRGRLRSLHPRHITRPNADALVENLLNDGSISG